MSEEANWKPCPWCGGIPTLDESSDGFFWIACRNVNCGVTPHMHSYPRCSTPEEAITVWNDRYEDNRWEAILKDWKATLDRG